MDVLVAGGAGFIGSNLVRRLVAEGHTVAVADNLLTGRAANLPPGVQAVNVDCAQQAYLAAFGRRTWDLVVHLAGASSAPLFDDAPLRLAQAVGAFQNSLEIARACNAKVAFASTSSVYARCPKPFREDMKVSPGTLYEASKLAMESSAEAYCRRYGLHAVALRFFSVYGPNEKGKGRFANVLSQFLWEMAAGRRPVVYGDGTQTRDFTHVDDILTGMLLAVEKAQGFDVYNIGTGVEHSFNDAIALLNRELRTDLPPEYVPNPVPNYVAETLADTAKLRALGWAPTISLEEGVRRIVADERGLARVTVPQRR